MDIFAIGVTLFVAFLIYVVIAGLVSSRRNKSNLDHIQDHGMTQGLYLDSSNYHANQSDSEGDWGGRDMSHDHHDSGQDGNSGDGGGDAGGGDAGGSSGE